MESDHLSADGLTLRECQVLYLMGQGLRNREIAERIDLGLKGVEFHIRNAYAKLGFTSPRMLVRWTVLNEAALYERLGAEDWVTLGD